MALAFFLALAAAQPAPYLPPPLLAPGQPVLSSDQVLRSTPPLEPHILFVNFDGALLYARGSCSDAPSNCSWIVNGGSGQVNYPSFSGTDSKKQQILAYVREYFSPFNVQIVTTRPSSGNYSMVMVGGYPEDAGIPSGPAGIAPLDCNDSRQTDISFAFSEVVNNDAHAVGVTIAQEAAHGFGLSHVGDSTDVMYPTLSGTETGFQNRTTRICNANGWRCESANSPCTGLGQQNSYQSMMDVFGPPMGIDTQAPIVAFRKPQQAEIVTSEFRIELDVSDNVGVVKVELLANGEWIQTLGLAPWQQDIPEGFFDPGVVRIKALAYDASGNRAQTEELSILVQAPGVLPGDIGALCRSDDDCPESYCLGNRHKYCSGSCAQDADCPEGFSCSGEALCALPPEMVLPGDNPPAATGGGGGGCSMTGRASTEALGSSILLIGLALLFRRRR